RPRCGLQVPAPRNTKGRPRIHSPSHTAQKRLGRASKYSTRQRLHGKRQKTCKRLAWHQASPRQQVEKSSESNEDGDEVRGDCRTGLRRQVFCEKAIGNAGGNQKEESLAGKKPEEKAYT